MSLTPKQARFVEEYLVDLNATAAAKRAGYSEKTAEQQGYQLLQKSSVQRAVTKAKESRSERTGITQDEVIQGLKKEATLEGDGSSHSARVAAWAQLGRHLGMFNDKLNLGADTSLVAMMKRIDGRSRGLP